MSATAIVAYTYQAEILCPPCGAKALDRPEDSLQTIEQWLDDQAKHFGIDRYDESSYDSGDFPKVVFGYQIEDQENCDHCDEEL